MNRLETWRFLDTGAKSPAFNMATDEALLILHSEGKIPPTIRFYTWEPATLTIGYFQQVEKEVNLEALPTYGLGFVRRPTGGRAVLHDQELTYSVIVSEKHPDIPQSVTEAYRVISTGLLTGFRRLGLEAYFSIPENDRANLNGDYRSAVCFDAPSWYELVVEGKKVAGSAQTRQRGVILQHGAILLDMDEEMLFDVCNFPSEQVKQRLKANFSQRAVAIYQLMGTPVSLKEVKVAFRSGFEEGLHIRLEESQLNNEELELINHLIATKYSRDDWNYKK